MPHSLCLFFDKHKIERAVLLIGQLFAQREDISIAHITADIAMEDSSPAPTTDAERESRIKEFLDITQVETPQRARFFLEAAGWNLPLAVNSFLTADMEDDVDMSSANPDPIPRAAAAVDPPTSDAAAATPRRFGTLFGRRDEDKSDEDSDDEGRQGFYAGGGQQVVGPSSSSSKKKKDVEKIVSGAFDSARQ